MYIIAEIGCNHNGDPVLAKKMVEVAKECGVNAVKFQTFNSKALISKFAPKAEYQIKNTGNDESQLEMTRKLELSHDDYIKLRNYAISLGLDVFSTGFDEESNNFLYKEGQRVWKVPSGELTNLPYLEQVTSFKVKNKIILLSTGMATIDEIEKAVSILGKGEPARIVILHCNTEYPTEDEDVNVSAIQDMQKHFPDYEIGFSDHSRGFVAPIMATAYGVRIIEKHFTLDVNMPGPDHKASIMPNELKILCESCNRAEKILGNGKKHVTDSERKNIIIARKSIVANCAIKKGEKFSVENLTCKRPGNGISPMEWYKVIGLSSNRDYEEDELIDTSLL